MVGQIQSYQISLQCIEQGTRSSKAMVAVQVAGKSHRLMRRVKAFFNFSTIFFLMI